MTFFSSFLDNLIIFFCLWLIFQNISRFLDGFFLFQVFIVLVQLDFCVLLFCFGINRAEMAALIFLPVILDYFQDLGFGDLFVIGVVSFRFCLLFLFHFLPQTNNFWSWQPQTQIFCHLRLLYFLFFAKNFKIRIKMAVKSNLLV